MSGRIDGSTGLPPSSFNLSNTALLGAINLTFAPLYSSSLMASSNLYGVEIGRFVARISTFLAPIAKSAFSME